MGLTNSMVQEMFFFKKSAPLHSKAEHCYGTDPPLSNYFMSLGFFLYSESNLEEELGCK